MQPKRRENARGAAARRGEYQPHLDAAPAPTNPLANPYSRHAYVPVAKQQMQTAPTNVMKGKGKPDFGKDMLYGGKELGGKAGPGFGKDTDYEFHGKDFGGKAAPGFGKGKDDFMMMKGKGKGKDQFMMEKGKDFGKGGSPVFMPFDKDAMAMKGKGGKPMHMHAEGRNPNPMMKGKGAPPHDEHFRDRERDRFDGYSYNDGPFAEPPQFDNGFADFHQQQQGSSSSSSFAPREGMHAQADVAALKKDLNEKDKELSDLKEQLSRTNTKLAEEGVMTLHLAQAVGEQGGSSWRGDVVLRSAAMKEKELQVQGQAQAEGELVDATQAQAAVDARKKVKSIEYKLGFHRPAEEEPDSIFDRLQSLQEACVDIMKLTNAGSGGAGASVEQTQMNKQAVSDVEKRLTALSERVTEQMTNQVAEVDDIKKSLVAMQNSMQQYKRANDLKVEALEDSVGEMSNNYAL